MIDLGTAKLIGGLMDRIRLARPDLSEHGVLHVVLRIGDMNYRPLIQALGLPESIEQDLEGEWELDEIIPRLFTAMDAAGLPRVPPDQGKDEAWAILGKMIGH